MSSDLPGAGRVVVRLQPHQRLGAARVPAADLVLRVHAGDVLVDVTVDGCPADPVGAVVTRVGPDDVVRLPRGTPFAVRAGEAGTTVEVTARPPGPERLWALAARQPAPPLAALVATAVELGVELLPGGHPSAGGDGTTAR